MPLPKVSFEKIEGRRGKIRVQDGKVRVGTIVDGKLITKVYTPRIASKQILNSQTIPKTQIQKERDQNFIPTRTTIKSSDKTRDFELGLKPIELFSSDRFTNVRREFNPIKNKYELKGDIDVPISSGVSEILQRPDVKKAIELRSKGSGGVISKVEQPKGFFPKLSQKISEKQVSLSQEARAKPRGGVDFKKSFGSIGLSIAGFGTDFASLGENIVRNPIKTTKDVSSGVKNFTKEFKDNPFLFGERFKNELQTNPEKFIGQAISIYLLDKGLSQIAKFKPVKTVSVKVGRAVNVGKNTFLVKMVIKTQVGVGKRAKIITTNVAQKFTVLKNGKISFGKGVLAQEVKKDITKIFNSSGVAFKVGEKGNISLIKSIAKIKKAGVLKKSRILNRTTFRKSLFKSEAFAKSNSIVGSVKKNLLADITSTKVFTRTKLKVFKDTIYVFAEKPLSKSARLKINLKISKLGFKIRYINSPQFNELNKLLSKIRRKAKGYKTINVDKSIGLIKVDKQLTRLVKIPADVKIKNIAKTLNARKLTKGQITSSIKQLKSVKKAPKGFKWTQLKVTDKISSPILRPIKSGVKTGTAIKGLSKIDKSIIGLQGKLQAKLINQMIKSNQLSLIQLGNLLKAGVISNVVYSNAVKKLISKASPKAKAQLRIKSKAIQQSIKQKTKVKSKTKTKVRTKSGQKQIQRVKLVQVKRVRSATGLKLSSAKKSKVRSKAKLRSQQKTKTKLASPFFTPTPPPVADIPLILPPNIPKFAKEKLKKGQAVKLNKSSLKYLPSLRGLFQYNRKGKTITKAQAIKLLKKGLTGLEVRYVVEKAKRKKKRKITVAQRKILIKRLKKARAVKKSKKKTKVIRKKKRSLTPQQKRILVARLKKARAKLKRGGKMVEKKKKRKISVAQKAILKAMRKKYGLGEFRKKK